jgi:hypothetical protein
MLLDAIRQLQLCFSMVSQRQLIAHVQLAETFR